MMKLSSVAIFSLSGFFLPLFGHVQAATNLTCTGCVGTTDLATNAVTTIKILNGTITNTDISAFASIDASKINDGSGSTLDADFFDGLNSSQLLRSDQGGTLTGDLTVSGGVGISGMLQSSSDSGGLFTGTYGIGSIPITGAGTRLMWYPAKAAFRVGHVYDDKWDDSYVGAYSLATGAGTTASGEGSTSMGFAGIASGEHTLAAGYYNEASGNQSVALGSHNTASGNVSVAMGDTSNATGYHAIAIGNSVTASGSSAVAMGDNSTASANYASSAIGYYTTANGYAASALGYHTTASGAFSSALGDYATASGTAAAALNGNTTASGDNATALGKNTTAQSYASLVIGRYNLQDSSYSRTTWVNTDPIFVIGNGSSSASTSNAMTVLKNGNVAVAGDIEATGTICDSTGCIGSGSSGSSQWTTSGSDIYYNSGNVGIGDSTPSYSVDASGYVRGQTGLCIGNDCRTSWPSSSSSGVSGSGSSNYLAKWDGASSLTTSILYDDGSDIGIGTTSPSADLDVRGDVDVTQNSDDWGIYVTSATDNDDEGAVYGEATTTGSDNVVGVWGVVSAKGNSSGQPIGVRGEATHDAPTQGQFGLLGYNYATTQSSGMVSAGVWGGAVGVPGAEGDFSGIGTGMVGETYSTYNLSAGGTYYALSTSGEAEALGAATYSSDGDSFAIYGSGNTASSGSKSAIVYTETQGPTALYVEESTEIYFTDYGQGQLQDGQAEIELDPLFLETVTISEAEPLMVFVEMHGPAQVYTVPQPDSFQVIQMSGEDRTATFSYRVVAKRKFYEAERLRSVKASIDQFMRPDLSQTLLRALNERWGLEYTGPDAHQLPAQVQQ